MMDIFVLHERWKGEWFVIGAYTSHEFADEEAKAHKLPEDSYAIVCVTLNAPAV